MMRNRARASQGNHYDYHDDDDYHYDHYYYHDYGDDYYYYQRKPKLPGLKREELDLRPEKRERRENGGT